ncbi:hypothetical protein QFC22_002654 [Naganishia vaughanmartiniae]|uniref:Uncharacterized protein n=1 Tax=Naganishia vaughanmartiniae TaxID=1424756 RepID=A0ACC2XAU0_9TREE|nr:hypothetical protein QFC22_002654 [Naganishia vaughanmartiniae]
MAKTIESQLFDVTKYHGECNHITVITYNEGLNGLITLFEITLREESDVAISVDLVGVMQKVPKAILKSMRVHHAIRLFSKNRSLEFGPDNRPDGSPRLPCFMEIGTRTSETAWRTGDGWRRALGVGHDAATQFNGLVATIPQMIALMHSKSSNLHSVLSTPPYDIAPSEQGQLESPSGLKVFRTVKIRAKPQGEVHSGNEVTVKAFYPSDSNWAKETILWA